MDPFCTDSPCLLLQVKALSLFPQLLNFSFRQSQMKTPDSEEFIKIVEHVLSIVCQVPDNDPVLQGLIEGLRAEGNGLMGQLCMTHPEKSYVLMEKLRTRLLAVKPREREVPRTALEVTLD